MTRHGAAAHRANMSRPSPSVMPCRHSIHHTSTRPTFKAQASARNGGACTVKICGITNAEDALIAAQAGADLIGMIMWPKAKRSVSDQTAKAIADTAKREGALPVGVFVDEAPETIIQRCTASGIPVAQLHGDNARAGLAALQGSGLQLVYVINADNDGNLVTPLPPPGTCDWVLIDGMQGGSGQALNWTALQPPLGIARKGWLLAGGLNASNVAAAIQATQPTGVDVSSGVCGPDGLKKVPESIRAFIQNAKDSSHLLAPQP